MKSKSALRQEFLSIRRNLDSEYKAKAHKKIVDKFMCHPRGSGDPVFGSVIKEILDSRFRGNDKSELIVGAYWPLKDEFDVVPILKELAEQHITCALPKLASDRTEIEFRRWTPQTKLIPNIFNILEPENTEVVEPNIIIVPYVVCDRECNRLGYGKGYYDKFLVRYKHKCVSVALCYSRQIANFTLPCEQHDQRLNIVITEDNIYYS